MKSQFYSIKKNEYTFKPLVIGQYRQLAEMNFEISDDMSNRDLFKVFITKLNSSRIMAIVLHPKSFHICEKDTEQLELDIESELTPSDLENMVNDFFVFCPLEKILEDMLKIAKTSRKLRPLI